MTTREQRVEQLEKVVAELQTGLQAIHTRVENQQLQFQAIMEKLNELRPPSSTPDARTPEPEKRHQEIGAGHPSQPHLDLPLFNGSDPVAWIARAEQFFLVHNTPEPSRLQLALIAMSGDALYWVQWLMRRSTSISWAQFTHTLLERFGDNSTLNPYEAMHTTRQTGSLEEYVALFTVRVAQLPKLPEPQYISMFLAGLQPDIPTKLPDSELTDVCYKLCAQNSPHTTGTSTTQPQPQFFAAMVCSPSADTPGITSLISQPTNYNLGSTVFYRVFSTYSSTPEYASSHTTTN